MVGVSFHGSDHRGIQSAGKLKNGKFSKIRKVNCAMLPPCRKTLVNIINRAVLVSRMWGQADTPNPSESWNPEEYSWREDHGEYQPVWFEGPALPENLRNVQKCSSEGPHTEQIPEEDDMEDLQEAEWSDSSGEDDE